MTWQLVRTSAQRGLDVGTNGFCTVARSRDLPPKLARTLESISGYRPLDSDERPVAYSCVYFDDATRRVVSRVADAGLDHTGRSNKIAHHIVLSPDDLKSTEPAAIFTASGLFRERWDGVPAYLDEPLAPASIFPNFCRCDAWKAVLDDPGWGGYVASTIFSFREVVLVVSPDVDVLRLFLEAIAVLPPENRWDATFTTYFTQDFPGVRRQWKAVYAGTPEAEDATRRAPQNALILDLTGPVPPLETFSPTPEEQKFIDRARQGTQTGVLSSASAARSPVSTPTAPLPSQGVSLADVYQPAAQNVAVPRVAPSVDPNGLRERRASNLDYATENPRRVDSVPFKRKSLFGVGCVVWFLATLVASILAFAAGVKYAQSQRERQAPPAEVVPASEAEGRPFLFFTDAAKNGDAASLATDEADALRKDALKTAAKSINRSLKDATNENAEAAERVEAWTETVAKTAYKKATANAKVAQAADALVATVKAATEKKAATDTVHDVLTASVKAATKEDPKSVEAVKTLIAEVVGAATAENAANDEVVQAAGALIETIANAAEIDVAKAENAANDEVAKAAEALGEAVVDAAKVENAANAQAAKAAETLVASIEKSATGQAAERLVATLKNAIDGDENVAQAAEALVAAIANATNGNESGAEDLAKAAQDFVRAIKDAPVKEDAPENKTATDGAEPPKDETAKEGEKQTDGAETAENANADKDAPVKEEAQTDGAETAENANAKEGEKQTDGAETAENANAKDDLFEKFNKFREEFNKQTIGDVCVGSATLANDARQSDDKNKTLQFKAFESDNVAQLYFETFDAWNKVAQNRPKFGVEIELLASDSLAFTNQSEKSQKFAYAPPRGDELRCELTFKSFQLILQKNGAWKTFNSNKKNQESPRSFTFSLFIKDQTPYFEIAKSDDVNLALILALGARIRYFLDDDNDSERSQTTEWTTLFKPSVDEWDKTHEAISRLYGKYALFPSKKQEEKKQENTEAPAQKEKEKEKEKKEKENVALELEFSDDDYIFCRIKQEVCRIKQEDSKQFDFWRGVDYSNKDAEPLVFDHLASPPTTGEPSALAKCWYNDRYNVPDNNAFKKGQAYVNIGSGDFMNSTAATKEYKFRLSLKPFSGDVKKSFMQLFPSAKFPEPPTEWTLYLAFPPQNQDRKDQDRRIRVPLATGRFDAPQ